MDYKSEIILSDINNEEDDTADLESSINERNDIIEKNDLNNVDKEQAQSKNTTGEHLNDEGTSSFIEVLEMDMNLKHTKDVDILNIVKDLVPEKTDISEKTKIQEPESIDFVKDENAKINDVEHALSNTYKQEIDESEQKNIKDKSNTTVIEPLVKNKCDLINNTKDNNEKQSDVDNNKYSKSYKELLSDDDIQIKDKLPKKVIENVEDMGNIRIYSREYLLSRRNCLASMIMPDIPECANDLKTIPSEHDSIIDELESCEIVTNIFMSRRNILQKNSMFKRKGGQGDEGDSPVSPGLVLGPQRRSFGTGCHAPKRNNSPIENSNDGNSSGDHFDRNNRPRFGSGRIHLSLSTIESGRKSSDEIANNIPMKWRDEPRNDRRNSLNQRQNDSFDRNDKDYYRSFDRRQNNDKNDDRNSRFNRFDNRQDNFMDKGRINNNTNRRGQDYKRRNQNDDMYVEPEWFTSGPESQSETIELHGFSDITGHSNSDEIVDDGLPDLVPFDMTDTVEGIEQVPLEDIGNTTINDELPKDGNAFDLTAFLNQCNINTGGESSNSRIVDDEINKEVEQKSRFQRLFSQPQIPEPQLNIDEQACRSLSRSSLNDEFAYLNELVNSNLSPEKPLIERQYNQGSNFLEMLQAGARNTPSVVPIGVPTPMSRANNIHIGAVSAEDLERNMKSTVHTITQQNDDAQYKRNNQLNDKNDMSAFNKLLGQMQIPIEQQMNYPPKQPLPKHIPVQQPFQRNQSYNEKMDSNIQAAIIKQKNIAMQQQQQQTISKIECQIAEFMKTNPNALAKITQKEQINIGNIPQGNIPQGNMTQGNMTQGNIPQGNMPQGNIPQGNMLQGNIPQGNMTQGNMTQGNIPQVNMTQGNIPQGNMTQGNIPQGNLTQGNIPQGNMSQGNIPQGNMTQGNILQGNSSQGLPMFPIQSPSNIFPPITNRSTSPIVFGNQPPMHITAPSPVHPHNPLVQANVNQQHHHNMMQQQNYLQNALVKKQLGDQLDRLNQRSKSPFSASLCPGRIGPSGSMHSPPVATVEPSFTPTSVIRRMANDKVDLDKQRQDPNTMTEQDLLYHQQMMAKVNRYGQDNEYPNLISAVAKNNADVTRLIERQLRQQHMRQIMQKQHIPQHNMPSSSNNQLLNQIMNNPNINSPYPGAINPLSQHSNPQLINDYNMAVLHKQQQQQHQKWSNDNNQSKAPSTNDNSDAGNLSKWFNVDALRKLPSMPQQLHNSSTGPRILTLDEIETLQQSVHN